MRAIDSSMYTGFQSDHQRSMKEIDRLNTQISSGRRIESSYEDTDIYSDALRLDNHQSALKEVQDRTIKSRVISDASDDAMQDFNGTLTYIKTKLIQAANAPMNGDNLRDLAVELEAQKDHLLNVANTSINGEYIFAGSATNVKPFDDLGNYKGNDKNLSVQLGRSKNMEYSINGKDLFLGVNSNVQKSLSTNVKLLNKDSSSENFGENITQDSKIGELIGSNTDSYFYLSGKKRDGESFKEKITLDTNHPVSDLLFKIGESFGNSSTNKVVDVTLKDGLIVVDDLKEGTSQIAFNLVGSSADVSDVSSLEVGVDNTMNFVKSSIDSTAGDSKVHSDSFYYEKSGNILRGNVPILSNGDIATSQSKLSEIANSSMNGSSYTMKITNVHGIDKDVSIDMNNGGSSFTIDGNSYDVFNAQNNTSTPADDITMGQLNNIISMVVSDKLPASNDKSGFDNAVVLAKKDVSVDLDDSGVMKITDHTNQNSKAKFSLFDSNADNFAVSSATISFMSNNALTTENANVNFFQDLDNIIKSVRIGISEIDAGNSIDSRSLGIEDAIGNIDNLSNHISRHHVEIGSMSKRLEQENENAMTLEFNVLKIKSEIVDTDMAESIMKLKQVSLGYEALLSTISKVNSLTLLNYIK